MVYKFYDTDSMGVEAYDLVGNEYKNFLNLCFLCCTSVAFCLSPNLRRDFSLFEKHKLPVTQHVKEQYRHYGNFALGDTDDSTKYTIVHYRLSEQIKQWLMTGVDSLFQWTSAWGNDNPDDPTFFRADGTVFFTSTIHEGDCTLLPKDSEDINFVVQQGHWEKVE